MQAPYTKVLAGLEVSIEELTTIMAGMDETRKIEFQPYLLEITQLKKRLEEVFSK